MNPSMIPHRESAIENRKSKAFTLLEVLLAVTILAFVGVAITSGLNDVARFSVLARQEAEIRGKLANQYALLRAAPVQQSNTRTDPDDQGVYFEQIIEPAEYRNEDDEQLTGIYYVKIIAHWDFGSGPGQTTLETLLYQP